MRRLTALLLALAAVASTAAGAPSPPTVTAGRLTVGIAMPSEGFQVGVVRGDEVIYARGLEIDLARALAARLGLRRTTFVQSPFDRLFSAGPKPWDLAIAQITITPARRRSVDFSIPYMEVDQGVLAAQTLRRVPTSIAALRALRICAMRKTTGQRVAQDVIAPTRPVRLAANVPTLMLDLQTGRCEAVVYDAPALGTLKARAPMRYGPFVGVIETREDYGIALLARERAARAREPCAAGARRRRHDGAPHEEVADGRPREPPRPAVSAGSTELTRSGGAGSAGAGAGQ